MLKRFQIIFSLNKSIIEILILKMSIRGLFSKMVSFIIKILKNSLFILSEDVMVGRSVRIPTNALMVRWRG